MTRRSLVGVICAGAAAGLLSGCGGGEDSGSSKGAESPRIKRVEATGRVYRIAIRGNRFVPKSIKVPAGSTVIWTNEDDVRHTVTQALKHFDSGDLGEGARYRRVFPRAGQIAYVCQNHYQQSGLVSVTG